MQLKKMFLLAVAVLAMTAAPLFAADKTMTMSTTTSTRDSGLLDVLLPALKKDTGIEVKVIAKGTGAAIRDGIDGNVDAIFVHDTPREEAFVADGYGVKRYAIMHNDFVVAGPADDKAGIKGSGATEAFKKIAAAKAPFISRGDDSGTHAKEQELWKATGLALEEGKTTMEKNGKSIDIKAWQPAESKGWYFSVGQGMGAALTITDEKQGYTLADRGTYIQYKYGRDVPIQLEILAEGDSMLANPYGFIPVNPAKHPQVKAALAEEMAQWLVSAKGQELIASYQLHGKQLFFPDAIKK